MSHPEVLGAAELVGEDQPVRAKARLPGPPPQVRLGLLGELRDSSPGAGASWSKGLAGQV